MQEGRDKNREIDWEALTAPFPAEDVEWRIQQSGGKKGDKIWALACAYVTSRAIMERLDRVVGPAGWKNRLELGPKDEIVCGISIRIDGEWVEKCDGAERTQIGDVKGGVSAAMKRAGVQWGIGRYLYRVEAAYAKVHENGKHFAKTKEGEHFKWDPPSLPAWALPPGTKNPPPGSGGGKEQAKTGEPCKDRPRADWSNKERPGQGGPAAKSGASGSWPGSVDIGEINRRISGPLSLEEARREMDKEETVAALADWMNNNRPRLKPCLKDAVEYFGERIKALKQAA